MTSSNEMSSTQSLNLRLLWVFGECFLLEISIFEIAVKQRRAGRLSSMGALLCLRKIAPPKYRVRLICISKHATFGLKQGEIGS